MRLRERPAGRVWTRGETASFATFPNTQYRPILRFSYSGSGKDHRQDPKLNAVSARAAHRLMIAAAAIDCSTVSDLGSSCSNGATATRTRSLPCLAIAAVLKEQNRHGRRQLSGLHAPSGSDPASLYFPPTTPEQAATRSPFPSREGREPSSSKTSLDGHAHSIKTDSEPT